jgi:hypothetical protein
MIGVGFAKGGIHSIATMRGAPYSAVMWTAALPLPM